MYLFELSQLVEAIQMVDNNLKQMKLIDCVFTVVCAIIRSNTVCFRYSKKIGFDISCKLSPHNLHEMSKPTFLEK